ncbi:MAG TPA: glycosyltransferase family 39 protein [Candidatus Binataceae bacterium]|nr:glycosyltransferase family 39 protein [Candidatus Binataceae bacterium]
MRVTHSSGQAVWDTVRWAWRSPRWFAMALLAVAVILGAHYRFHRLDRWDLSGDEGQAWAGAIAPSVAAVIAAEPRIENGGKLPLYDLLLHAWIGIFGDRVASMRRLSAVIGTMVIVLVFVAVREVFRLLGDESSGMTGELAGAFAALIYATNLTMVVSDRTAREYPLLLATELLQIVFFLRAQRRGAPADYVGTAIFTAAMIAVNYSSSFLLFAEALWLGCLLAARWMGARAGGLAIARPGIAVAAGVALLAPLLPLVFADSERAVRTGAVDWIKVQPLAWPFTTLRDAANRPALFWIFAALGVYGVWRQRRSARVAAGFLAAWMAGPLLAAFAVTYLISPMEFSRYVLIAFLGLFAFAGLGAAALDSTALRIALAILLVYLSARPIHDWLRNYHELGWREAAALAARETAPGDRIAVCNSRKVNVVRYYLAPDRRADAEGMGDKCGSARVLIVGGFGGAQDQYLAAAQACYPRLLARVHAVEVRTR